MNKNFLHHNTQLQLLSDRSTAWSTKYSLRNQSRYRRNKGNIGGKKYA